jgi:cysteine desulfurase
MERIYLDTAAATPLDARVWRAMRPWLERGFGNPSSLHQEGVSAAAALAAARAECVTALGVLPDEIIFTAGGTEANNLAITAAAGGAVMVSAIEHPSVLAPCLAAGRVIIAPVLPSGQINLKKFAELLTPKVKLVSVMYANNEIGAIQPLSEITKIIRRARKRAGTPYPYFHTDACQAGRFLPLDVRQLGVDLLTINAGKIYGPKGVGLLYVRRGVPLTSPILIGGGQEAGRRAGTENVPGIVGLATALTLAGKLRDREAIKLSRLRDWLWQEIKRAVPEAQLNGSLDNRLPNNLNLYFPGVLAEQLVLELDAKGIAASIGSACSIPKADDSYVIMALGHSRERATGSIRISLGRDATKEQLKQLIKVLPPLINKLTHANYAYAADLNL